MAWGYEKCFTIEHDNTLKRRIDCKDCIYYDSSDKSCMKRPLYLPVDGYNSWRNCKYFELDHSVSHYDEKSLQYVHELARRKIQREQQSQQKKTTGVKKTVQTKQAVKPKEKGIPVVHDEKIKAKPQMKRLRDGSLFCVVETFPKGKKLQTELVPIIKSGGSGKKIMIGRDAEENKIYITNKAYTKEAIEKVYQVLNGKSAGKEQK
ncbi:hypothetical protein F170042I7_12460 [Blautia caecimuris]|uniref:hypothetical protein n=1 Tax=Blautia caecimuris TaxID=1796615 RepID=UPI0034B4F484